MLMYVLAAVLMTLYALIAGFALFMTYDEQRKTRNNNPFYNALSVLACLFWPVTVLTVVVAVQRKTA